MEILITIKRAKILLTSIRLSCAGRDERYIMNLWHTRIKLCLTEMHTDRSSKIHQTNLRAEIINITPYYVMEDDENNIEATRVQMKSITSQ